MSPELAQHLAEIVHGVALEPNGRLQIAHVARVARSVPAEARTVAWLHDVLERSSLTVHDLRHAGLGGDELEAIRLLTRGAESDDRTYLAHVERISRAPGRAGRLARLVKAADLADRLEHPRAGAGGFVPPYADALDLLESGGAVGAQ